MGSVCRNGCDEESGVEVNTQIWFDSDIDGSHLDLAGLADAEFELVCAECHTKIDVVQHEALDRQVKARIEEFAEANGARFAPMEVSWASDRMREAFDQIAARFQAEEERAKFEAIIAELAAESDTPADEETP